MSKINLFSASQTAYFPQTFAPLTMATNSGLNEFLDPEKDVGTIAAFLTDDTDQYGEKLVTLLTAFREAIQMTEKQFIAANTHHFSGLPNKRLFESAAGEELEKVARNNSWGAAFIILDADKLKAVNDTFGMEAGDKLLANIAGNIRNQIQGADIAAHFGGDGFAVLMTDCTPEKAEEFFDRLRRSFEGFKFKFDDQEINVSASMGMANAKAGETYSDVMARADQAMRADKTKRAPVRGALEATIRAAADPLEADKV